MATELEPYRPHYHLTPARGWLNDPNGLTSPWSGGSLTVPYELTLHSTTDGPRLSVQPVDELLVKSLRLPLLQLQDVPLTPGKPIHLDIHEASLDIELELDLQQATRVGLVISTASADGHYQAAYDATTPQLEVDRRDPGDSFPATFRELIQTPLAPYARPAAGLLSLRILLDRNCIELFAQNGSLYSVFLPAVIFPAPVRPDLSLFAEGGDCRINRLSIHRMPAAVN